MSVLGLFSDAKVRCGIIENISECPVVAVKDIERKIAEVAPGKDNTVCIEFCTGEEEVWNQELAKIAVKGGTSDDRVNFYTALYHSMIAPTIYSDVDGAYFGPDGQTH